MLGFHLPLGLELIRIQVKEPQQGLPCRQRELPLDRFGDRPQAGWPRATASRGCLRHSVAARANEGQKSYRSWLEPNAGKTPKAGGRWRNDKGLS